MCFQAVCIPQAASRLNRKETRLTVIDTQETVERFRHWEHAVSLYGEAVSDQTGDAVDALAARLAVAAVIDSSTTLREQLDPAEVQAAGELLAAYNHVSDPLLARLASEGWLDVASCSCEGCDSLAYVPALPPLGWLLFVIENQHTQNSDLLDYLESLGGSPEGYREFVENVLYPDGEDE